MSVDEYKHAYPFGEFETRKALLLRIGRNERLWRMSVISNHRFTDAELEEWQNVMRAERQKMPSVMEINTRKAQMRKAVFGVTSGPRRIDSDRNDVLEAVNLSHNVRWGAMSEHVATYSEGDVAKIVDARRKRNEAARFRERQIGTVARLNHGQSRTRYEHEFYSARDAYATLLLAQSSRLEITPELKAAIHKVEFAEAWQRADNNGFDHDIKTLASKILETRRKQQPASHEPDDCRVARKIYDESHRKLIDFQKNALDLRKKRDIDAPSRTSTLHAINETKKHENALADMAYGEKKIRDEHYRESDADHSIFQRRATKPTLLWTTKSGDGPTEPADQTDVEEHATIDATRELREDSLSDFASIPREIHTENTIGSQHSQRPNGNSQIQRQRNGMSLQEYLTKSRAATK